MMIKLHTLFLFFITTILTVSSLYAQYDYQDYYNKEISKDIKSHFRSNEKVNELHFDSLLLDALIFSLTNEERLSHNMSELNFYNSLYSSANLHSFLIIKHDFFNHINKKNKKWKTPSDRVFYFDDSYFTLAENILENNILAHQGDVLKYRIDYLEDSSIVYKDLNGQCIENLSYIDLAKRLVSQWMNSPPHRANILNDSFTHFACACSINIDRQPILIRCTQNFGGLR